MIKEDVSFTDEVQVLEYENYTIERNKPMPNILHGNLQSDIIFQLRIKYDEAYDFPSEVSLNLKPGATPDICVYPKRKLLDRNKISAKESEMPITTIEIISPSQSLDMMTKKIRKQYFPAGVRSAWIVVPAFKAVHVMLPGDQNFYFDKGELHDPATGIQLSVDKVFERVV